MKKHSDVSFGRTPLRASECRNALHHLDLDQALDGFLCRPIDVGGEDAVQFRHVLLCDVGRPCMGECLAEPLVWPQ